jgi:hypothetical protein
LEVQKKNHRTVVAIGLGSTETLNLNHGHSLAMRASVVGPFTLEADTDQKGKRQHLAALEINLHVVIRSHTS